MHPNETILKYIVTQSGQVYALHGYKPGPNTIIYTRAVKETR